MEYSKIMAQAMNDQQKRKNAVKKADISKVENLLIEVLSEIQDLKKQVNTLKTEKKSKAKA